MTGEACTYLYRVLLSTYTSRNRDTAAAPPLGVVSYFAETAAACPDVFSEAAGCVRRKSEAETGEDCFGSERLATRSSGGGESPRSCVVRQQPPPDDEHYTLRVTYRSGRLDSTKLGDVFTN